MIGHELGESHGNKKIVVTHMTGNIPTQFEHIGLDYAEDGKTFELPE